MSQKWQLYSFKISFFGNRSDTIKSNGKSCLRRSPVWMNLGEGWLIPFDWPQQRQGYEESSQRFPGHTASPALNAPSAQSSRKWLKLIPQQSNESLQKAKEGLSADLSTTETVASRRFCKVSGRDRVTFLRSRGEVGSDPHVQKGSSCCLWNNVASAF